MFEIADAAVFLTEFARFGPQAQGSRFWPLGVAVALRAAVLLTLLVE